MAENFRENKLEIVDGHQVVFDFPVYYLPGKLLWQTVKDYDTNCHTLPTSWLFQMQLQQPSAEGSVSIPITLKRNDNSNIPVNAYVTIRFTDANSVSFFDDLIAFGARFVKPGEELKETVSKYIRLPEKRKLFNEYLLATVVIRIRNCHSGFTTNPLRLQLSSNKKRKLCAVM